MLQMRRRPDPPDAHQLSAYGKAAVAAESGGAAAVGVELPEQPGLVLIGVTCS